VVFCLGSNVSIDAGKPVTPVSRALGNTAVEKHWLDRHRPRGPPMHLSLVDPENLTALSELARGSAELSKMETALFGKRFP
jgi:hypothetical protein